MSNNLRAIQHMILTRIRIRIIPNSRTEPPALQCLARRITVGQITSLLPASHLPQPNLLPSATTLWEVTLTTKPPTHTLPPRQGLTKPSITLLRLVSHRLLSILGTRTGQDLRAQPEVNHTRSLSGMSLLPMTHHQLTTLELREYQAPGANHERTSTLLARIPIPRLPTFVYFIYSRQLLRTLVRFDFVTSCVLLLFHVM